MSKWRWDETSNDDDFEPMYDRDRYQVRPAATRGGKALAPRRPHPLLSPNPRDERSGLPSEEDE